MPRLYVARPLPRAASADAAASAAAETRLVCADPDVAGLARQLRGACGGGVGDAQLGRALSAALHEGAAGGSPDAETEDGGWHRVMYV